MDKNNIYMPVLSKGIFLLVLPVACLISMFITIFLDLFFYLIALTFEIEYSSIFIPFVTVYLVIFMLILLFIPSRLQIKKLTSIYYKNEKGELIRYRLNLDNVVNFEELSSATVAGTLIGGTVNSRIQGMLAMQGLVKVMKGIKFNTNKTFVLENLENETFYQAKKINKTELDSIYQPIDQVDNTQPIRFFRKTFTYTAFILLMVIIINSILLGVAAANTDSIKESRSEISQSIYSQLQPFGYVDMNGQYWLHFQREDAGQVSNIRLNYNKKGELNVKETEVQVYWSYEEEIENIVNELQTIFSILEMDFDERKYTDAIQEMLSGQGFFSEKTDRFNIYLSQSTGHIELMIYKK